MSVFGYKKPFDKEEMKDQNYFVMKLSIKFTIAQSISKEISYSTI